MRPIVFSQAPESSPCSGSGPGSPGLLARLRERIHCPRYGIRTDQMNVHSARAFVRYHAMRHPCGLG
jgi:hypothetical protein